MLSGRVSHFITVRVSVEIVHPTVYEYIMSPWHIELTVRLIYI